MDAKMQRRDFLKISTATAVAPIVGEAREKSGHFSAYDKVSIGKTGIQTSRLCFGTGIRSINRHSMLLNKGRSFAVKLLREAYEHGIHCFDLADTYGSHQPFAEAMQGVPRDKYTIITKIWWRSGGIPEKDKGPVPQLIERFLRELKTDYIDVVQLHCVDNATWPTDLAKEMEGLEEAKKQGKIRAHGISIHAFSALHRAPTVPWLDVAHVRINPYGKIMAGSVSRNVQELKRFRENGKGLIGIKILGEGALSNDPAKIDHSLSFVLQNHLVDVVDIGFLSIDQIDDIAARIAKVEKKDPQI